MSCLLTDRAGKRQCLELIAQCQLFLRQLLSLGFSAPVSRWLLFWLRLLVFLPLRPWLPLVRFVQRGQEVS